MSKHDCFFGVRGKSVHSRINFSNVALNARRTVPFIDISDDLKTVDKFLSALYKNNCDDPKTYVSKNYISTFDFNELSDFFSTGFNYTNLIKVEFDKRPKNCKTNSILIPLGEGKKPQIVHLHMIKEPDLFSSWKIYGIEKE